MAKRVRGIPATGRTKAGMSPIMNNGIYNVKPKLTKAQKAALKEQRAIERRQKKLGIYSKGGNSTIMNDWNKRVFEKKDGSKIELKGATVVHGKTPFRLESTVSGVTVVLGDERTYTDAMLAEKHAPKSERAPKKPHKVRREGSQGYMRKHSSGNGKRVIRNKEGVTINASRG